jgi:KDO2-lipid IV(A) lauroyltransferase
MPGSRISHLLEYSALTGGAALLRTLPHGAALKVGAALGSFAFKVVRVRRAVAESNASAALGCAGDDPALGKTIEGCYKNLGMSLVELTRLPVEGRRGLERLVSVEGLEHFDRALCNGKGAVLATGHFGNWELMGAALAQRGYPMNFLVGHQTNRMVDAMLNSIRAGFGIGIVKHGAHIRKVLRLLERNQFVAMLCDHDAGSKGLMIRFFDMPASSAFGPAVFSLRSGAPIIMGFILRDSGGGHHVELSPPVQVRTDLPPADAVVEATQRMANVIEEYIRRRPDHWYWVHRRWKTAEARGLARLERELRRPMPGAAGPEAHLAGSTGGQKPSGYRDAHLPGSSSEGM